jgi:hypothetical protein
VPEFPIDSPRMRMDATGVVNAVMQWGDKPDGKKFKTDKQDRDPNTGMLKWGLEVFHRRVNFGEDTTAVVVVEVGAAEKPDPAPMTPVTFEGLEVSIFPNKAGGFQERWSAEAIADIQQRPGPKTDTAETTSTGSASTSKSSSSSSSRSSSAAA